MIITSIKDNIIGKNTYSGHSLMKPPYSEVSGPLIFKKYSAYDIIQKFSNILKHSIL